MEVDASVAGSVATAADNAAAPAAGTAAAADTAAVAGTVAAADPAAKTEAVKPFSCAEALTEFEACMASDHTSTGSSPGSSAGWALFGQHVLTLLPVAELEKQVSIRGFSVCMQQ